eukprot:6024638-Pyramimonas_sp.AAC.1
MSLWKEPRQFQLKWIHEYGSLAIQSQRGKAVLSSSLSSTETHATRPLSVERTALKRATCR